MSGSPPATSQTRFEPVFAQPLRLPRGPHRLSAAQVRASQRQRLMRAVTELVGERGYGASTLAGLIRYAGVSRSTFYELYADKEDCLLDAYEHFVQILLERTALHAAPAEDWERFVGAALDAYLRTLDADRVSARAMLVEMAGAGPRARTAMRAAYRSIADLLSAHHRAARAADPTLGPLPDSAFMGTVLGIRDIVQEALEVRPSEPLLALAPELSRWLRATVLGAALVEDESEISRALKATAAYDQIGVGYQAIRRTDPKLARRIWSALGDARTVLNVGAGPGSYEPSDRWVLAAEPSRVMIAQRPAAATPVLQTPVEALPLADRTVDAAMAILTIHHWSSAEIGLRELRRVTRKRIVIVTMDPDAIGSLWMVRDYLPELMDVHAARFPSIARLRALLPGAQVEVLAVPHDCQDGFMGAFWARPRAYLDPAVRAATSPWHDLPVGVVDRALVRLQRDLDSGAWQRRHGELCGREELDVGLRLLTASL